METNHGASRSLISYLSKESQDCPHKICNIDSYQVSYIIESHRVWGIKDIDDGASFSSTNITCIISKAKGICNNVVCVLKTWSLNQHIFGTWEPMTLEDGPLLVHVYQVSSTIRRLQWPVLVVLVMAKDALSQRTFLTFYYFMIELWYE